MTRKKKSRKPGVAPVSASKDDKKKALLTTDKKPKKHKGKKSGNRQQEAVKKTKQTNVTSVKKDARIGSKKPIELKKLVTEPAKQTKTSSTKPSSIAAVHIIESDTIENKEALEQEIFAIEDDNTLQAIIDKQEQELPLTESEVDYFNEKMDRHQELKEQLGWNDEEATEIEPKDTDEDALWDKLDSTDFSEFE